ncbi:MAG: hypothetical protein JO235_08615 [Chroococcidiopsidaceae cyanobacterium CP_BM_RX_35]|nr:hypothetical protein [Chroococcidiopsidaceae cyanobacterium CP_BM_RX_35]
MSERNPSILERGQSKWFKYFGEQIPNQVFIQNLSTQHVANYIVYSGKGVEGWSFYGSVEPNSTASIWVHWTLTIARFSNNSVEDAAITIGGDGIFPAQPPPESEE